MTEQQKIPKHWEIKKLGEVCKFIGGGTPSKQVDSYWNGDIPWASIKDIKGAHLLKTSDYITEDAITNSSTNIANPEELILATRINPGKVIISKIRAAINQDLKIVRPKIEIDTSFLYYSFQNLERDIIKVSSGTTVLGIGLNQLNELDFILPPLQEQEAIVAKIEELLSDLENGKQQLLKAQQQLKVYRQSLLKWAFEGELTKKSILKDVTERIQIGPFGTQLHKEDYIENGIPLINPMHIQDGKIKANYSYSISSQKCLSLPNYILKEGDVIMGRRGEMGRCGLVTVKEAGWFCGTGSLYFRPLKDKLKTEFLYYYLISQPVKKYLEDNAGGTTMANLNLKIVNNIPISMPSISEQESIVSELESKLTVCDKLEETISQSLAQSETLRQSILKKAFEGRLV